MALSYSDPLEKPQAPERVNYRNGVLLDENDFQAEQEYFRGRLSRALSYLLGYGTLAGLEVKELEAQEPQDAEEVEEAEEAEISDGRAHVIQVMPGLAIDRIGRIIEVPVPYCIRAPAWFAAQDPDRLQASYDNSEIEGGFRAVVADLFIKFNVCERGMTPAFGVGNVDATDAFAAHRLLDSVAFELLLRSEPEADKPRPDPHHGLPPVDRESPLSLAAAIDEIRRYKYEKAWKEEALWNKSNKTIIGGPEHLIGQNGTEVLLARIRLPATSNPMRYETNEAIQIDDSLRLFCYSTYELFWLINAI